MPSSWWISSVCALGKGDSACSLWSRVCPRIIWRGPLERQGTMVGVLHSRVLKDRDKCILKRARELSQNVLCVLKCVLQIQILENPLLCLPTASFRWMVPKLAGIGVSRKVGGSTHDGPHLPPPGYESALLLSRWCWYCWSRNQRQRPIYIFSVISQQNVISILFGKWTLRSLDDSI